LTARFVGRAANRCQSAKVGALFRLFPLGGGAAIINPKCGAEDSKAAIIENGVRWTAFARLRPALPAFARLFVVAEWRKRWRWANRRSGAYLGSQKPVKPYNGA